MALAITATDGRQALIRRRRHDGFDLESLPGEFKAGERFEVMGGTEDERAICIFVVGRVRNGRFRARAIEITRVPE